MATYAFGDIQGCYDPLRRLLDVVRFDPARDRLWFVGDLANRGPQTLETLRFVRSLGEGAITVLGNHDLHLLVVAAGVRRPHKGDTLEGVLTAPDRDELLDWLRRRPLMHTEGSYALVHAGLLPQWTTERAAALAREFEQAMADDYEALLTNLYGNQPEAWDDALTGHDRLRVIVNAMTRLRLCDARGRMEFSNKGAPDHPPAGYMPWFDVPDRASADTTIVFGHWAALGLTVRNDVIALDSGCVWGRELTAMRLDDRKLFQCGCGELAGLAQQAD